MIQWFNVFAILDEININLLQKQISGIIFLYCFYIRNNKCYSFNIYRLVSIENAQINVLLILIKSTSLYFLH